MLHSANTKLTGTYNRLGFDTTTDCFNSKRISVCSYVKTFVHEYIDYSKGLYWTVVKTEDRQAQGMTTEG